MINEIQLHNRLLEAYNFFKQRGHEKNIARIKQLAAKLRDREFGIAFVGHFSAGKSRMINYLCGAELLPSSPIPTSANLVRVHSGRDEYARVFFRDGSPRKYLAPYDYDMVRSFCKDGDQVTIIELSHRVKTLPEQVVIMDTPGIDSADEAHRLATEDALHMADIILYVMDYNHVQAELNFTFTRDLTNAGKEVYLVVNQIDKHQDSELPFESFKNSIQQAFDSWGVKPAGIFYTSLRVLNQPENQLQSLQDMLWGRIELRDKLIVDSIEASLNKIYTEYVAEQDLTVQDKLTEFNNRINELSDSQLAKIKADYDRLKNEQAELNADWQGQYQAAVEKILANAYLMPTSTRDLAASYLESCQPDFKVGFFNRAKKTEAERNARKKAFYSDIREKAKSQIEWHLRTFILDFLRQHNISDSSIAANSFAIQRDNVRGNVASDADAEANVNVAGGSNSDINEVNLTQLVQELKLVPHEELLQSSMREGAKLTKDGSYVMNYTGNVAEGIKTQARKLAEDIEHAIQVPLQEQHRQHQASIDSQLEDIANYTEALDFLTEHAAQQQQLKREIDEVLAENRYKKSILTNEYEPIFDVDRIFQPVALNEEVIDTTGSSSSAQDEQLVKPKSLVQNESSAGNVTEIKQESADISATSKEYLDSAENTDSLIGANRLHAMAKGLAASAELIKGLPGMKRLSQELSQRAHRLDSKGFMVTLFGAFSAGKSSFANSMLGERLLPVSPNPTTAAINKIMPVDSQHPHGTVLIKLKDEKMLLADVNQAFKAFNINVNSLAEAGSIIGKTLADSRVNRQRQKSFLRAFQHGYHHQSAQLGQVISCTLQEFPSYAADEAKSCFVEWIEVYYDCQLTRQGITLVDTPGADSINARHTDTSFNFIRQSDAILFVTYYNHAFSRADREFLIQLGRVKDAFQMDKMFFIINAIDLAEDEKEAAGVMDYVRQQLRRFGVRKPQLHALSSKQLLEDRIAGKIQQSQFEKVFYNFVFNDLTNLVLENARHEQLRVAQLIDELIKASEEDVKVKHQRRRLLQEHRQNAAKIINALDSSELHSRQKQELQELVYYVKQRVFFRYLDFFRESFNPADLRSSSNTNQVLLECLHQLLENLGFDLAQELRATTLRLENFLRRSIKRWQDNLEKRLQESDKDISLSKPQVEFEAGLEFSTALIDLPDSLFTNTLKIYKNPRQFFEAGGSQSMADAMEAILSPQADFYLQQQLQIIGNRFTAGVQESFIQRQTAIRQEVQEFYTGHIAALDGGMPTADLKTIKEKLILE